MLSFYFVILREKTEKLLKLSLTKTKLVDIFLTHHKSYLHLYYFSILFLVYIWKGICFWRIIVLFPWGYEWDQIQFCDYDYLNSYIRKLSQVIYKTGLGIILLSSSNTLVMPTHITFTFSQRPHRHFHSLHFWASILYSSFVALILFMPTVNKSDMKTATISWETFPVSSTRNGDLWKWAGRWLAVHALQRLSKVTRQPYSHRRIHC